MANNDFDVASVSGALIYRAHMDYFLFGKHFNLFFLRTITSEEVFLYDLEKLLVAIDIFGIIFIVAFGKFFANKVLRPIKLISNATKSIKYNNLDNRIDISQTNDELSELAANLNNMLDRLQSGIIKQNNFLSDASHELRTPAAVFTNYADLLQNFSDDKDLLNESINAIRTEAVYLNNLLKNLTAVAKSESTANFQKINLAIIVNNIIQTASRIINSHNFICIKNDNAFILADYTTFIQLLRIFIDNAVKYSPAGSNITIASVNTGNCAILSIQDNGCGIAPDNINKIFERNFRVSNDISGNGLGLSIAKRIADNHNISINVISTLGIGTTFTLTIPTIH